jgi:hypothetical protein
VSGSEVNGNRLLSIARGLLGDAGFSTRAEPLDQAGDWLLAENRHFIVGVVAGRTLEDVVRAEAFASTELAKRVAREGVGGKRWDVYVVLLAEEAEDSPQRITDLVELQHNTQGLRRLVSVGVPPASAEVADVLRPFLPLPRPAAGGVADALSALTQQLVVNGIDEEAASRYVAAFVQTGTLDDV